MLTATIADISYEIDTSRERIICDIPVKMIDCICSGTTRLPCGGHRLIPEAKAEPISEAGGVFMKTYLQKGRKR